MQNERRVYYTSTSACNKTVKQAFTDVNLSFNLYLIISLSNNILDKKLKWKFTYSTTDVKLGYYFINTDWQRAVFKHSNVFYYYFKQTDIFFNREVKPLEYFCQHWFQDRKQAMKIFMSKDLN